MKIVVLDGYTANPGDLSWNRFEQIGNLTVYPRTAPEDIIPRAQDAGIVLTNKTPLGRRELEQLPHLRYIGVLATGYNVIDVAAAEERDIVVTNVPGYGTMSVAQHAFALLLEMTNHVGRHSDDARFGGWVQSKDWCYWKKPIVELDGLTVGLVGRGRIGDAFARLCEAAGMKVLSVTSKDGKTALLQMLSVSDVISLHCPLTPQTEKLINRETLSVFKPNAYLINTARGQLIDEADLADALNEDRLAGAALDVLSTEPPAPDNPLLTAKNCLITPHLAWASVAARQRLLDIAADNLQSFLNSHPKNKVSSGK